MPMPMFPPAPPRLSTTTCCPHDSVILWATRRAMVSVAAPGANGTMMRIGRVGYCASAACAAPAPSHDSTATSKQLVVTFIFSSLTALPATASLRRNVGVLHNLRIARRFGFDERGEFLRRAGERLDARVHQALLEIGGIERLDQFRIQSADE